MKGIKNYARQGLDNGSNPSITISRWISANAIFTAPSILITYGIMEGIVFGFAFFLATVIIYFLFCRSAKKQEGNSKESTDGLSKIKEMRIYFLVSSYMQLYLMVLGGGLVISILFQIPIIFGMILFVTLSVLYSLIKYESIFKHHLKLALLFVVTTGVLVYLLVMESVEQIYQGIRLYHPYLLYVNLSELFLFILAVSVIFIGKLMADPFSYNNLNKLITNRKNKNWFLLGFVWGSIPLSFVSIILSIIYRGGFESVYTIFQDLFLVLGNSAFTSIIAIVLALILIDTSSMEIEVLRLHGVKNKRTILFILIALSVFLMFSGVNWLSFSFIFFITGIWIVAFLPIMVALFLNKLHYSKWCASFGIVSSVSGYISLNWFEPVLAVLFTLLFSLSIVVLQILFILKR